MEPDPWSPTAGWDVRDKGVPGHAPAVLWDPASRCRCGDAAMAGSRTKPSSGAGPWPRDCLGPAQPEGFKRRERGRRGVEETKDAARAKRAMGAEHQCPANAWGGVLRAPAPIPPCFTVISHLTHLLSSTAAPGQCWEMGMALVLQPCPGLAATLRDDAQGPAPCGATPWMSADVNFGVSPCCGVAHVVMLLYLEEQ